MFFIWEGDDGNLQLDKNMLGKSWGRLDSVNGGMVTLGFQGLELSPLTKGFLGILFE